MAKDIYSPHAFGVKVALELSKYLPDSTTAARQMAVAGLLSAAMGGARSYFDPGYDETFDETGKIISRKRRNPTRSALHSAGLGLGIGALGNYAAQVGNNIAKDPTLWHHG